MTEHYYFRASAAHRELECTAAWRLYRDHAEEIKAQKSSDIAQRGTDFHKVVEMVLQGVPFDGIDQTDPELARMAAITKEYVDGLKGVDEGRIAEFIERKMVLYLTDRISTGGTVDYALYRHSDRTLDVVDHKSGFVKVDTESSYQLKIYAMNLIADLGKSYLIDEIKLHIAQPSVSHFENVTITREELAEFEKFMRDRTTEAITEPVFRPSMKTCNYCFFMTQCQAFKKMAEEVLDVQEITQIPAAVAHKNHGLEYLTDAQLSALKDNQKIIALYFQLAEVEMMERMQRGTKFEKWELGEKNKHRILISKEDVIERFKERGIAEDDLYDKKLKSLSKLASMWGAKNFYSDFRDNILKPRGEVAVVPVSRKDRVGVDISQDFEDFE